MIIAGVPMVLHFSDQSRRRGSGARAGRTALVVLALEAVLVLGLILGFLRG